MNVSILGDRRIPLPKGWSKETLVGILGDTQVDATAIPEPGASLRVVGLFSDTTVRVPSGCRIVGGGLSVFGDRQVETDGSDGPEIRIDAYGLFCDLKVIPEPRDGEPSGDQLG